MTLSGAKALFQLSATAKPTGTNVGGSNLIGVGPTPASFSTADIAYSFKLSAMSASDVATLTLTSGSVAQTTGTPTITDGDGKDYEGVTLPTAARIYAILISGVDVTSGVGSVFVNSASPPLEGTIYKGGDCLLYVATDSLALVGGETVTFTASALNGFTNAITVTVLGKSS